MIMSRVGGCLLDLDGTVTFAGTAITGAAAAIARIRAAGVPVRFGTNTTRYPRSVLVEQLASFGIEVDRGELFTAPVAAAGWLRSQGAHRVSLLLAEATHEEFAEFERDDDRPEWVVVGDLGEAWDYATLNRAFRAIHAGAGLMAIQRNRVWDPGDGLRLDAGPFIAALEYATGTDAVLVGKPAPAFFATAAQSMGVAPGRMVAVGDGVENDVGGAHTAGCLGVAVRTGTFRDEDLDRLDRPPDAVLDSIADLPGWLGLD